ncbi:hypothetical protein [Metapseudomonas otitidis]|uniref:hypothetical protein n=1 Tax=Metapseudomonas otitidis TaxID=319939 RepID=UPI001F0E7EC1|nr:hypothetical protein [Pseudomonas otitidis]
MQLLRGKWLIAAADGLSADGMMWFATWGVCPGEPAPFFGLALPACDWRALGPLNALLRPANRHRSVGLGPPDGPLHIYLAIYFGCCLGAFILIIELL